MQSFCFDAEIAKRYGVDAAVMLWNLDFWIQKNKSNGRHFYDGRWWTYNSAKAFTELFPFWTAKQVTRILGKLEDEGVIISGNYNTSAYDRTKWYAIDYEIYEGKSKTQSGEIHLPVWENGNAWTGEPIPDNTPDINPDNNHIVGDAPARKPSKSSKLISFEDSEIAIWEAFVSKFGTDEYAGADLEYYYGTIKDWAAAKGAKYKDWVAFVRNWMRRDFKEGKLVRKTGLPGNMEPWQYKAIQRSMELDDDSLWAQ